jgi:antitoxin (DNA-binding transcriptional repressor) of toxin-antitoxin stability system
MIDPRAIDPHIHRMSDPVTIDAANTDLLQLISRVENGEEIVIARGNKLVAKIGPVEQTPPKRVFGSMKHLLGPLGPEFFEPLPEDELRLWNGESN